MNANVTKSNSKRFSLSLRIIEIIMMMEKRKTEQIGKFQELKCKININRKEALKIFENQKKKNHNILKGSYKKRFKAFDFNCKIKKKKP